METNVNYTIVGAFVIVLLSTIIMGVIWLSSGFSSHSYSVYQVNMKESVTGLSIDSAVEFNGVNVGTVKTITISPQDPQTVVLLLNVDSTTPITQGTRASLTSKGLTGVSYVSLIDKGLDKKPLLAAEGKEYPIINTIPSLFNRFDTAMVKLNENVQKVTNAVQDLLDDDNLASIKNSLKNMREFTNSLVESEGQIQTILHNTAMVSAQFPGLITTSSNAMHAINEETLPMLNQAMINLQEMTQNMVSVTHTLKQNPAVLIRGKTPEPLGPGEK
jgi:phospholipid/cholesterol/gamma-HCH transport system substrate-binding protein